MYDRILIVEDERDLATTDVARPDAAGHAGDRGLPPHPVRPTHLRGSSHRDDGQGRRGRSCRRFEIGADDYVVKLFSLRELSLRVRAALRRQGGEPPVTLNFGCGKRPIVIVRIGPS